MKIVYNSGMLDECQKEEELHIIRHTAAHIMAQAIKRLYPYATLSFGPANDKGFYYDVDLDDTKLSDDDLPAIELEMRKIIKENLPIKPFILSHDEAIDLMKSRGNCTKLSISEIYQMMQLLVSISRASKGIYRCPLLY